MATRYLLPCPCGEKIAVEIGQAGQRIVCSCGQTLEVPTMQGIRKLEISADSLGEPRRTSSLGGVGIGIALLGCLILGSGGAYASWVSSRRPIIVDIDYTSPWETWLIWQDLQEGVRLPEYSDSPYLQAKRVYDQYMTLAIAVIVVGIITIGCGVVVDVVNRRSQHRQTSPRAP